MPTIAEQGIVPLVDAIATHDAESGRAAIFLVNRSPSEPITVTVDLAALGLFSVLDAQMISDADVYAKNTKDEPERVALTANTTASVTDGVLSVTLPAVSWTALSLG